MCSFFTITIYDVDDVDDVDDADDDVDVSNDSSGTITATVDTIVGDDNDGDADSTLCY